MTSRKADMLIAISGTHFSGKSTLVEALSEALPHYTAVEEPYVLLAEEGQAFADPPTLDEFELQLERSIEDLTDSGPDVIFDRCPADMLGYILSQHDADAFALDQWLPRVRTAVGKLDLIVFLQIEEPDRIALPSSQEALYRQQVDEKLKEILLDDPFRLEVYVLEVSGSLQDRADQVLSYLRKKSA